MVQRAGWAIFFGLLVLGKTDEGVALIGSNDGKRAGRKNEQRKYRGNRKKQDSSGMP